VGRLLVRRGERVIGTVRSAERAAQLAKDAIEPVLADVLDPECWDAVPAADRLLYCVGFDRAAGIPPRTVAIDGLRHVLECLTDRTGRLVYASTTGVYGQDDGGWVDEQSPTEPRHEGGRIALDAEHLVRAFERERGLPAIVLRFAGLYGPGRLPRSAGLARGEIMAGDPGSYLNLVHVDDAAAAAIAALDRGAPGEVYLVCDDRPIPRIEFFALVADHLGVPAPRFEAQTPGPRRDGASKRVSNRKMRMELGVTLAFSDIGRGVPAALIEGRGVGALRDS
jgi:nucleoside-diphosphate-sugar epimerase